MAVVAAGALITNIPIVTLINWYGPRYLFTVVGLFGAVATALIPFAMRMGWAWSVCFFCWHFVMVLLPGSWQPVCCKAWHLPVTWPHLGILSPIGPITSNTPSSRQPSAFMSNWLVSFWCHFTKCSRRRQSSQIPCRAFSANRRLVGPVSTISMPLSPSYFSSPSTSFTVTIQTSILSSINWNAKRLPVAETHRIHRLRNLCPTCEWKIRAYRF